MRDSKKRYRETALPGLPRDEYLLADVYRADYEKHFWQQGNPGFWKLERKQFFREPRFHPWTAFSRGDWDLSMELLEAERPALQGYFDRISQSGFNFNRVRIVDRPIIPYLQWELHVLHVRMQCGEQIRIVNANDLQAWENNGTIPELITLGTDVMYQIDYGPDHTVKGAMKYPDCDLVAATQEFIDSLYSMGEDLDSFFEREIKDMNPPGGKEIIAAMH